MPAGRRVRLAWYYDAPAAPPAVRAGERWRFPVRLKAPRGLRNPGGADSERYALADRLSATGYVEWVLGDLRPKSALHLITEIDPTSGALFARNPYNTEFADRVAFWKGVTVSE